MCVVGVMVQTVLRRREDALGIHLRWSGRTCIVHSNVNVQCGVNIAVMHIWPISWHKICKVFRCKWALSRSISILDVLCIMEHQRRFKDFESKFKEVGRQVSFRRFMKNLRFSSWGWRIPTWSQQMFQGELFYLIKHSLWWLLSDPSPIIGNACQ